MANLFVVWNIKNRCVDSIHETNGQAVSAARKTLTKAGTSNNDKKYASAPADFEVITVTR